MIEYINRKTIASCLERGPWTLGNEVLYRMCANNFKHDTDDKIIAKVWLIGRSYSAAIERRKNKDPKEESDNFYTETVVNAFKACKLDSKLEVLSRYNYIDINVLELIIETHYYLTDLISKITNLNKRSFSAKYLHFHLPELFFIYDSRAAEGISKFNIKLPRNILPNSIHCDQVYGKFAKKSFILLEQIRENFDIQLTPRQLDNLLLKRVINNMK
jgi:hypothetical protein